MSSPQRRDFGQFLGCWLLVLGAAMPTIPGAAAGQVKTVETSRTTADLEEGVGADHRVIVSRAHDLLKEKKYDEASALLKGVLAHFDKLMNRPDRKFLCFANRSEFELYQKENPGKVQVVWLDWGFGSALHHQAFIHVARKEYQQALEVLDKEIRFRPYSADPWVEKGFVLNKFGKFQDALKAYQQALELAEKHASSKHQRALALRGIGYTQVELRDLPAARKAYRRSLEFEPNNPVALEELKYIDKQEGK